MTKPEIQSNLAAYRRTLRHQRVRAVLAALGFILFVWGLANLFLHSQ